MTIKIINEAVDTIFDNHEILLKIKHLIRKI